ncbi:lectin OAA [Chloroflexia bacterium SDU3-3]|nr:lectin OAA [Chloroflexia bacterium SDU3-3]
MATYAVENQWGGPDAPWHAGGTWVLGARSEQSVVAIDISSSDGGDSFFGTMTYANEGPIGLRATLLNGNSYNVENQWGGSNAPWHPGGTWVIGGRDNQHVIELHVSGDGDVLDGTNTYVGEGPIGFHGVLESA